MTSVAELDVMSKPTILTKCEYCATEFLARKFLVDRGGGRFCSTSCSAKGKKNNRRYDGAHNPNWKGGVSQNRTDGYKRKLAHKAKHPEKVAAREAVAAALRNGSIERQPCEVCGERNTHGHHDDYSKPLAVRWLCRPHHQEHHRRTA